MDSFNIPEETVLNILQNLSPEELLNYCETSTQGRRICQDDTLWHTLYIQKFNISNKINDTQPWFINYVLAYRLSLLTPQQRDLLKYIKLSYPDKWNLLLQIIDLQQLNLQQNNGQNYIPIVVTYTNNYTTGKKVVNIGTIEDTTDLIRGLYILNNRVLQQRFPIGFLNIQEREILNNTGYVEQTKQNPYENSTEYIVLLNNLQWNTVKQIKQPTHAHAPKIISKMY